MSEMDPNDDGYISFYEYVMLMENFNKEKYTIEKERKKLKQDEIDKEKLAYDTDDLLKAFRGFDIDKKDYITCLEFKYIMENLGDDSKRFTEKEVELIFKTCDLKKEGKLYYKDFITIWRRPKK